MRTYVQLINFTQQGVKDAEKGSERLDQAKELMESLGGEMTAFYLTMGQYDAVVIAEFPDDETITRGTFRYLQEGTIETETMRAFNEDEYRNLIENLPE